MKADMASYLELARTEVQRLDAEIARLQETRDAWATILRNSTHADIRSENIVLDVFQVKTGAASAAKEAPRSDDGIDEAEYGWRINAVRDIFRSHPDHGFTAGELWKIIREKNISNRQGFVYSTLARLTKKQGQLKRVRGKYYANPAILDDGSDTEKGSTLALPLAALN